MQLLQNKCNIQNNDESGKAALSYVLKKFQYLAIPYWVALILRTLIQIILYAKNPKTVNQIIFRMFPEIFAVIPKVFYCDLYCTRMI